MINRILTLIFLCSVSFLQAQVDQGLVTYISFDDCTADESRGNPSIIGVMNLQDTICGCGVKGRALKLNGQGDHVFIAGAVNSEFDRDDFTISFYFKPVANNSGGVQTLLYKSGEDCSTQSNFAVRYDPRAGFLNVQFVENSNKSASINSFRVPEGSCWFHIVLARRNLKTILYVNGELAAEVSASDRVDVRNDGVLTLGESYCSATDRYFSGFLDELRIYNRALSKDEVGQLYFAPDKILTQDTRVFLGESFNVNIANTCASDFLWTPTIGVDDSTAFDSDITPEAPGSFTYKLDFKDSDCTAFDTVRVIVIDPNSLDCEQVFMPSAFTPNSDGTNDVYGISNPEIFVFGDAELSGFEIFDRWGNLVFQTVDPRETWDGFYKGQAVNPGVMLFKVRYTCQGEEKVEVGSLTIIR